MNWEFISKFVEIKSPWVTLIGEKLKDDQGNNLDYWRVEKDDSLIVITEYKKQLIFPKLTFRVGIKKVTLDFAGGRVNAEKTLTENALLILKKELNIEPQNIKNLIPINHEGWIINSAFSNQLLWGFYALIDDNVMLDRDFIGATYNLSREELPNLLDNLTCLQCRSILLESICQGIVATS
ncbi:hypothetical protein ACN4EE_16275 [Geminocystis sp. CENA526]|uniref:hypothetical protein n=1 Tax=Geminocystis sp. CENA526 TaxID=1355871 RepID=UPI003D6F6C37